MKFTSKLVLSGSLIVLLAACSRDPESRRQAKQDFNYLDTPPLQGMVLPEGKEFSEMSDYVIPSGEYRGGIGNEVDIRSPVQVLELIPGARTQIDEDGTITMWLQQQEEQQRVWRVLEEAMVEQGTPIKVQEANLIETDWLIWEQEGDADFGIESRYRINQVSQDNRYGFQVRLLEWRKQGVEAAESDRLSALRYNTIVTNIITSRYDQMLRKQALLRAQQQVKRVAVNMGQDRSGLPVIIARAEYDVFWERLPILLEQTGFTISGRNRSQGEIEVKFKAPNDEYWQEIGIKPIRLDDRSYTLQLGDLGNRTSINVTDNKGKPVPEEALETFALALASFSDME
ncbi:outer membrane protein assembly factor BamC [Thaumasiovibrio sp. DFM-14]|uniref:outer membrane protein assembly factor BamC n=1 Tax=Thaumasiovibrio sp. DFM-14 TaxID=3384792 RepID=UPI0039A3B2DE